jgi:hypothetical protein
MSDARPTLIAINHDEYAARYAGRTADRRQFFLTTPFVPAMGSEGEEFVALYLFDAQGGLIEAQIDTFGARSSIDMDARSTLIDARLASLGDITFDRIAVAPFAVERFGTQFGLIPREPEDEDDEWAVEAQPGDYMAFFEPWDSGEYDT